MDTIFFSKISKKSTYSSYNILYISILYLFIFYISLNTVCAQFIDNGQNPPGLKWKEISTENFKIIFPKTAISQAQQVANLLEYLRRFEGQSLRTNSSLTTIVLQNQTVISNGFMTLAPRRIELFTTAPQQTEPTDWLSNLAVHELRHLMQVDKAIKTKKINAPLLEEIQFALFGASYPTWLIEGDAVVTETTLTNAGRGRVPAWHKAYRANLLSDRDFTYSKYLHGSFKDLIPDYYRLGYFMASKIRRDYGNDTYNDILETSIKRVPLPPTFSTSLHKYTGMNNNDLFKATMGDLNGLWRKLLSKTDWRPYRPLNKRKNIIPVNLFFPHFVDSTHIIYLKKGLGIPSTLVLRAENGKERNILKLGPQLSPYFDYQEGKLVWDELKFDPRFQYRDYSVINIYDIRRKKFKQLTHQSRLFSPSLSADGSKIIAVRIDEANQYYLVTLNAENGETLWQSEAFEQQIHFPVLNKKGDKIAFMMSENRGRSIWVYDLKSQEKQMVKQPDFYNSEHPVWSNGSIIFTSHYNGTDNIYQLNPESGAIEQLTFSKFGAYHADFDVQRNRLLFNNYSTRGMDIVLLSADSIKSKDLTEIDDHFVNYSQPIINMEFGQSIITDSIPQQKYAIGDYKGLDRLFNFHSISPTAQFGDEEYGLGLRLKSTNILNTLSLYGEYAYNFSLESDVYKAGIAFQKYYPKLSLDYSNEKQEAFFRKDSTISNASWREHKTNISITLPLNFTKRNYLYGLRFSTGTESIARYNLTNTPGNFVTKINFPLTSMLSFSRQSLGSPRDLAPRFGQMISLGHKTLAFDKQLGGEHWALKTLFYFPGLFKHHSLSIGYNYQHGTGQYKGVIEIPEISGHNHFNRSAALKSTLLLDYRFPICYPDLQLGSIAYIKRLKGGFFADYDNFEQIQQLKSPDSYGLELRMDVNFFRIIKPDFDIGTKVVIFNNELAESPVFELLLNYSL